MRVTDKTRFDVFKNNLTSIKEKLDTKQINIASGKKILTPSDDPVTASLGVQLGVEKDINDQHTKTLEKLKTIGGFYETSISSISDLLTKAKEIAITQASSTMDASTRESSSEEIKGIIEQLVSIGNTKVGINYIFGGKNTSATPFTMDDDYTVTYNGTRDVSSVYIDRSTKEASGISGDSIFVSDADIFDTLKKFKDALEGNDLTGIKDALDNIEKSLDKTQTNLTRVGTYAARIDSYLEYKESRNIDITQSLSDMLDVDVAKAITDFNALSTAYEAMIYCMSKVQNLTILNYLN